MPIKIKHVHDWSQEVVPPNTYKCAGCGQTKTFDPRNHRKIPCEEKLSPRTIALLQMKAALDAFSEYWGYTRKE